MTTAPLAFIETVNTPDGSFMLLTDEQHRVLSSGWTADRNAIIERLRRAHRPSELVERRTADATAAARAVEAYYAGDLAAVASIAVVQHGTELQRCGWDALRQIEPGSPLSYTDFAQRIGREGAVRAAASVCARNAPALFVPCHRVLRSDGSLGGFAWGTDVKRSLLDREALRGR